MKYLRICSTTLVIQEIHIKNKSQNSSHSTYEVKIHKIIKNIGEIKGKRETSFTVGKIAN